MDSERNHALYHGMPESDPAFPIVSGILGLVPASEWNFARIEPNAMLRGRFGSGANAVYQLAQLGDEIRRQRAKVAAGPRIAATLGALNDFASGVTLLFADARMDFAILTLLRRAELGPFTSSEISMLTFALDALSDRLAALRLAPLSTGTVMEAAARRDAEVAHDLPDGAFYVLDPDLRIVLAWSSEEQRRLALTGLHTQTAERLPLVIEDTVRAMTDAWASEPAWESSIARPVAFLVVRTQPMSGPAGRFIGVRIDRFVPPNSLTGAATRFHISPREIQVLALLLDGNHLDGIGLALSITSSTVQDHIKSMLDKTGSGNRSELIARVLGWESPRRGAALETR